MIKVRLSITLACILSSLSAVLISSILFISDYSKKKILVICGTILSIGSLIGGIIGIIFGIFFVKKDEFNHTFHLGVSILLAIIAVVLNLFGTIFATLFIIN
jgi:nicotinamide riboside transporter PnuC